MKKEHIIEEHGKTFVTWAGLLEEAHDRGLQGFETHLVQAQTAENGRLAIVHATAIFEGKRFDGIGDASPENTNRKIVQHAVRMAETRAKARALRDALNIGATALEELGDEDSPPESAPRTVGPAATEPQIKAIWGIAAGKKFTRSDIVLMVEARYGCAVDELSKGQASAFIEWLKSDQATSDLPPPNAADAGFLALLPGPVSAEVGARWADACRAARELNLSIPKVGKSADLDASVSGATTYLRAQVDQRKRP